MKFSENVGYGTLTVDEILGNVLDYRLDPRMVRKILYHCQLRLNRKLFDHRATNYVM